jgi:hypothetical protein
MVEHMQRWEYHLEPNPTIPSDRLNKLGAAGWKLSGVDNREGTTYIFRRPAQSFVERVTLEQRARYYKSLGLAPEPTS